MNRDPVNQSRASPAMAKSFTALLDPGPPSLAAWYADPLPVDVAAHLQDITQRELQARLRRGGACFQLHVLQLICLYWREGAAGTAYRQLVVQAGSRHDRALLELAYGQLLISRTCLPALDHLRAGFDAAVEDLGSATYLQLLRRHALLACLPLTGIPSPARGLRALLREAAVIQRLQDGRQRHSETAHHDTVG